MAFNTHIEALVRKSWTEDEAYFVEQHIILKTVRSSTLRSPVFKTYPRNSQLVVIFSVSEKRRTIVSVTPLKEAEGETWGKYLYNNRSVHRRRLTSAIDFATRVYKPGSYEEKKSIEELEKFEAFLTDVATGVVTFTVLEKTATAMPVVEFEEVKTAETTLEEMLGKFVSPVEEEPEFFEEVEDETSLLVSEDGSYMLDAENNGYWIDSNVFVASDTFDLFSVTRKMIEKAPKNLMMVGPSGYGKTTVPQAFAETWEMRYFRMNCASIRDPEEWFGYREARDGETVFVFSPFAKAVMEGNVVIVLDEFNRVEPWLHNTLYPLLDHDRKTVVHGEEIKCGPNVMFVATVNLGFQFVGTFSLDSAITNRMDAVILVDALPTKVEEKILKDRTGITQLDAKKIVGIVQKLREISKSEPFTIDISTRSSLKVADFVSAGLKMEHAFKAVLINAAQEDEAKRIIDAVQNNL